MRPFLCSKFIYFRTVVMLRLCNSFQKSRDTKFTFGPQGQFCPYSATKSVEISDALQHCVLMFNNA